MREYIVTLPDECIFNVGVTLTNYLVADTNNSINFKKVKIELPFTYKKWCIYSIKNNIVYLREY